MRRSCARPTCSFPATASVLIDLTAQAAELVDLAEPALGHHHLCGRHAASTTVPMGWSLTDGRSPEITLWTELPDRPTAGEVRVLHPTPAATVPSSIDAAPLEPLPFATPVDPAAAIVADPDPAEVFARHTDSEGSDALAAVLGAGTPLLSRAFSEIRAS